MALEIFYRMLQYFYLEFVHSREKTPQTGKFENMLRIYSQRERG